METFNWRRDIQFSYINLNHRPDRNNHMILELNKAGIEAKRFEAIPWKFRNWDVEKYGVMLRRTPGACGCWLSQVSVMAGALVDNKSAGVLEDDLTICSDFQKRMDHIEDFLNHQDEWDIMFLGGTVHVGPPYWHASVNPLIEGSNIGRDAERTIDPNVLRVYGAFSTHAYIVNKTSILKILRLLEEVLPLSMGIDWAFIKLAPQLKCFMFVPGCIKQIDNESDIGNGITVFSGFSKLNGTIENSAYWWQDKMENFNPSTFNWQECELK